MASTLENKVVAVIATHGFEQSELLEPVKGLRDAGAKVEIIAPEAGEIRGWTDGNWGDSVKVDRVVKDASAESYDALVLPGGVLNPDKLRGRSDVQNLVRAFFEAGKPVSAICHGPQVLIDCGVLKDRRVTSYHSIKQDLINAGAEWVDEAVVTDQGLTTSRTPDDLPQFVAKTIEEVAEGVHAGQTA